MKYLLLTIITLLIVSCVSSRPCQREELLPEEVALQYFLDTIVPQHDSIFAGKTIVAEGKVYVTDTYYEYMPTLEFYKRISYYFELDELERQKKTDAGIKIIEQPEPIKQFCPKRFGIKKVMNLGYNRAINNNLIELEICSMKYQDTDETLVSIDVWIERFPQKNKFFEGGLVVKANNIIYKNSQIAVSNSNY